MFTLDAGATPAGSATFMDNLDERATFWDVHHREACQGSTPTLVESYAELFKDKDVLEIGPGEGRQFDRVSLLVRSYAVADISLIVLAQERYRCVRRIFLTSLDDLHGSFDVVHAWYVFHHVLKDERSTFFTALHRCLKDGGVALFNLPSCLKSGEEGDDGMKTTPCSLDECQAIMQNIFSRITVLNKEFLVIQCVK